MAAKVIAGIIRTMIGPAAPDAAIAWTRALALAATVALLVLCVAWELWLAPTGRGTLALKALPLLVPLRGLARLRLYTYRWTSLLVWLYVAEGAVRATSERGLGAWLAGAEAVLATLVFVACALHVRARFRHAGARTT
jgi:uncharacterized membrane protein